MAEAHCKGCGGGGRVSGRGGPGSCEDCGGSGQAPRATAKAAPSKKAKD